ncbi:IS66 family transposase [Rhizobium halophilum]|uniref:IS66 family transposase n=1 Tax=Rhizobium halophilum TaxID=2846852 RepID=UPI00374D026B
MSSTACSDRDRCATHPEVLLAGRQRGCTPLVAGFHTLLALTVPMSRQSLPLAKVWHTSSNLWTGLKLFLTDGPTQIDNNSVERPIGPVALNLKHVSLRHANIRKGKSE